MGSEIERFYSSLLNAVGIHSVIIVQDSNILKTNLDEEKAKKFIGFADEILNRAEKSLGKIPELTGEINFVSIFLQNNIVILIAAYEDYKLIVVAKGEETGTDEIKGIMEKISELLK